MRRENSLKTAPGDRVPFGQKAAFGVGMLANQMFHALMMVFTVFLVMALNMDPLLAGILAAAPRVFDAITDPIMGYVTDNARTRWGRRRPFIFVGAILAGLSYILMWQLHPENSTLYNFFYFLFMSLVFYLGYTIFATPLIALGYEMSSDYHERTSIMAVSQWIGQIAWMVTPWAWVIVFLPMFDSPAQGSRELAVVVGTACMLLALVPAILCKEPPLPATHESKLSLNDFATNLRSFFGAISETLKCRPFLILCAATFLVFNAYIVITQFQYYIFVHYVFGGDGGAVGTYPAWYGTLAAFSTVLVAIPLVAWLARRIGKRNAFVIAMSISVVGYLLKFWFFSPEMPWLIFLTLPLTSCGIGGLFTLMMSMTSDVCDVDELNSGQRREGMFAAVYWWFVKLGQAIAMFLGGLTLSLVGFDESAGAIQTEATMTQLRLADAIIPAVGTLLGIIVMKWYDVDEAAAQEVRDKLEARRGKKTIYTESDDEGVIINTDTDIDGTKAPAAT